jgi:hypothetical protein
MDYLSLFRQARARLSEKGTAPLGDSPAEREAPSAPSQPLEVATKATYATKPPPCPGCGNPLSRFASYDMATETHRSGLACLACASETEAPSEPAPPGFVSEPAGGSPVYWERGDGTIVRGRAVLLGRYGETFWFGVEHADGFAWVHERLLRSRSAYEAQQADCHPPAVTWRTYDHPADVR